MLSRDSLTRRRSSVSEVSLQTMGFEEDEFMDNPSGTGFQTRRQRCERNSIHISEAVLGQFDDNNCEHELEPKAGLKENIETNQIPQVSITDNNYKSQDMPSPELCKLERSSSDSKVRSKLTNKRGSTLALTIRGKVDDIYNLKSLSSGISDLRSSGGSCTYSTVSQPESPGKKESNLPIERCCNMRKIKYGLCLSLLIGLVVFLTRTRSERDHGTPTTIAPSESNSKIWEMTDHSVGEIAHSRYGCSLAQSSDTKVVIVGECGLSVAHVFISQIEDGSLGTKFHLSLIKLSLILLFGT